MATYMKLTSDAWRKLKPVVAEISTISFCANTQNAARRRFGTICGNSGFDRHVMFASGVRRIGQGVTAAGHSRSSIVEAHVSLRNSCSHHCVMPRRLAGSSDLTTAEGKTIVKTISHGAGLCGRLLENRIVLRHLLQARTFSSGSRGGGEDDLGSGSGASGIDESGSGDDASSASSAAEFVQPLTALSPMTVPEVWPRVPVIAVRRNPLFPRFVKMIEASSSLSLNIILYVLSFSPCKVWWL